MDGRSKYVTGSLIMLLPVGLWGGDPPARKLQFQVDERARLEAGTGIDYRDGMSDAYLLNKLRFQAQLRATSWIRLNLQVLDARVWGLNIHPAPASFGDSADIRQASVELGGGEGSRFGLHLGRQPINLGEGRLIADPGWGNVGRSFDAARMTLRTQGLKLDLFSASVVQVKPGKFNRSDWGNTIHGAYLTASRMLPGTRIEPYFFWKRVDSKGHDFRTIGARWAGVLPRHFDFGLEAALQSGSCGNERIGAWAWHSRFGHTITGIRARTRLFAEYNHASGDRLAGDRRRGTFDELFPSAHDRFGLADQIMWSNMQNAQGGVDFPLFWKVRLKTAYTSLWLAQSTDGLYRGGQRFIVVADGSAGRHVGEEIDLQGTVPINRRTQISAGYGRLFPGYFLRTANRKCPFNFYFLSIGRTF